MTVVFNEFGLDDGEVGVDNGGCGRRFLSSKQQQLETVKKSNRRKKDSYAGGVWEEVSQWQIRHTAAPRLLKSARTWDSCRLSILIVVPSLVFYNSVSVSAGGF